MTTDRDTRLDQIRRLHDGMSSVTAPIEPERRYIADVAFLLDQLDAVTAERDHAAAALAGDSDGVRLWMLDCAALTAKHRDRADTAEAKLRAARELRTPVYTPVPWAGDERTETAYRAGYTDALTAVGTLLDTPTTQDPCHCAETSARNCPRHQDGDHRG